jgi:hypothetical protein
MEQALPLFLSHDIVLCIASRYLTRMEQAFPLFLSHEIV